MSKLLFLPLDITLVDTKFVYGDQITDRQLFWITQEILGRENNFVNYQWLLDQTSITKVVHFTHKFQSKTVGPHYDEDLKKMTLLKQVGI